MNGWRVFGLLSVVATAAFVATISAFGTEEAGIRALVRTTARISFAIFVPVYLASPLRRLWPNAATRWVLRNRRYLGVSFAWAHGLHLLAIGMLVVLQGDAFESNLATIVFGGITYVLMFGMAATSFDRSARWLGPKRWYLLHRSGIHMIWLLFTILWTSLAANSTLYLALTVTSFGLPLVRIAGNRKRRSTAARPAES